VSSRPQVRLLLKYRVGIRVELSSYASVRVGLAPALDKLVDLICITALSLLLRLLTYQG
jgi:hypothetical protein